MFPIYFFLSKSEQIGADEALVAAIQNLMKNTKQPFEKVCISMGISKTDMARYKKMI